MERKKLSTAIEYVSVYRNKVKKRYRTTELDIGQHFPREGECVCSPSPPQAIMQVTVQPIKGHPAILSWSTRSVFVHGTQAVSSVSCPLHSERVVGGFSSQEEELVGQGLSEGAMQRLSREEGQLVGVLARGRHTDRALKHKPCMQR